MRRSVIFKSWKANAVRVGLRQLFGQRQACAVKSQGFAEVSELLVDVADFFEADAQVPPVFGVCASCASARLIFRLSR